MNADQLAAAEDTRANYDRESRRVGWKRTQPSDRPHDAPGKWAWSRFDLFAVLVAGISKWSARDDLSGRTLPIEREIFQRVERLHPKMFGWLVDQVLEVSQEAEELSQSETQAPENEHDAPLRGVVYCLRECTGVSYDDINELLRRAGRGPKAKSALRITCSCGHHPRTAHVHMTWNDAASVL